MVTGRVDLRPVAGDVRAARDFCARQLAALLPEVEPYTELFDDAAIVTSELVTNSLRAGASTISLSTTLLDGAFRISVRDDAPGEVRPGTPDELATGGRGLNIVAAVCSRWGVDEHGHEKDVWAELSLPGGSGYTLASVATG